MLTVDHYGKIRQSHRDGMSIREIARRLGHSRKSVRKALVHSEPARYQRQKSWPTPKFTAALKGVVDAILEMDECSPAKQRHWSTRIFERLRDEHGYVGGYDQVRRYVQTKRRHKRETYLPLVREPGGRAECDFGHIAVDFPEGRRSVSVLLMTWSYSNAVFAMAMPTERVEAILAGLTAAVEFFGCVPRELWWDNPTTVAAEILRGRDRVPHDRYKAWCSHYVTEPLFCMPRRGNEKPSVENRVKTMQRRWATPVPRAKNLAELNTYLLECCARDQSRPSPREGLSIREAFDEEQSKARSLPVHRFDPCIRQPATVDKYQTVPFDGNRYSVPRSCSFQTVTVKGYIDRVEIIRGVEMTARHSRCYGKGEQVLDPLHYLVTLSTKPALLDHTKVYRDWKLPALFGQLRTIFEQRDGARSGARQYIRVLELLAEHPVERITDAIHHCRSQRSLDAMNIRTEVERLRAKLSEQEPANGNDSLRGDLSSVRSADADLSHFNHLLVQGGT
ncbi:MAG: IS21 family transposase [Nitrospiraceae bacterium]|nr:IS21 family transposase [Nitrospiraceae bacterium]